MKRDFHLLIQAVEKKLGKKITLANEVGKLCQRLKKTGKLTPSSLDKLALFVGFQNWKEFQNALHGDEDGQVNYNG